MMYRTSHVHLSKVEIIIYMWQLILQNKEFYQQYIYSRDGNE